MLRLIRQNDMVEGPWRNGMGVSWEIASYREPNAAEFSWRFAKARIDRDVPFSIYPGIDRIFMQLSGNGLDLEFEGGKKIEVHESFVPHSFACDLPLNCKLRNGPCFDLNLFTVRGAFRSEPRVMSVGGSKGIEVANLDAVFFALRGAIRLSGRDQAITLNEGDAALAFEGETQLLITATDATLFVGLLHRL